MRPTTLCFPINAAGEFLLGRKKRGFGVAKWNGFGGKLEAGETFRQCAVRELQEESGLVAKEADLELVAFLDFRFDTHTELDHIGYVYLVHTWQGTPAPTEDMEPRWFSAATLPYEDMWSGDRLWIPMLQARRKISGTIVFAADKESLKYTEFTDVADLTESDSLAAF